MNAAALAVPISLPLKFQAEHFGHRRTVYDTEFSACSMYSAAIPISNQKDKEGKQGWVTVGSLLKPGFEKLRRKQNAETVGDVMVAMSIFHVQSLFAACWSFERKQGENSILV